jgi:LuxR family transcriptional regulator, quorum-sensing system regulator BjaR1
VQIGSWIGWRRCWAPFGYTAFLITGLPEPPERVESHFLLNRFPPDWIKLYSERNYYPDDPVAAYCRRSIDPFEWSEATYDAERWPRAAEIMARAADFGLEKGFLVPIIRGNGLHACVTMAGQHPDFDPLAKRAIHLISMYAHAKAVALRGSDRLKPIPAKLSERERETLAWAAGGKLSWDNSKILRVSDRTVNRTIVRAAHKLHANSRVEAIVDAIRAGESASRPSFGLHGPLPIRRENLRAGGCGTRP